MKLSGHARFRNRRGDYLFGNAVPAQTFDKVIQLPAALDFFEVLPQSLADAGAHQRLITRKSADVLLVSYCRETTWRPSIPNSGHRADGALECGAAAPLWPRNRCRNELTAARLGIGSTPKQRRRAAALQGALRAHSGQAIRFKFGIQNQ